MQLPLSRFFLSTLLCGLGLSFQAQGADILPIYSNARALGMGNAQYALVSDKTSVFYNPAGLARARGFTWSILGVGAGINSDLLTNYESFSNLDAGSGFSSFIDDFYGDQIFANASGLTAITLPFISLVAYNQTYASIAVHNPVYPELPTRFINDYGYAIGLGLPIFPMIHMGVALKRIKRTGAETTYRASSLADLDPEVIKSDLTKWGVGYGLDFGGNLALDLPFVDVVLSAVWQNIGDTTFRSENLDEIPTEKSSMGLGAGVLIDLPLVSIAPAIDITHLNRSDIQLLRKINMGVEVGIPLLDLRAGFQQGYYTLGAGVGLGPIQVDVATYGVELGDYPGQIEDRRYMVEFTLELGLGSGTFGGSSSESSGRSSIWGGRRLKQRR